MKCVEYMRHTCKCSSSDDGVSERNETEFSDMSRHRNDVNCWRAADKAAKPVDVMLLSLTLKYDSEGMAGRCHDKAQAPVSAMTLQLMSR